VGIGQLSRARIEATWPERALGAGTAAALIVYAGNHVFSPAPLAPAAMALIAASLVLVLPRIGWITLAAGAAALAVGQHRPGIAMVIVIAALLGVLASPRTPTTWPLPAAAAALGAIGLATAWPAAAARAPTMFRRAALAAAGWGWVVLLSAGASVADRPPPSVWGGSPYETWHHLLVPIVTSGALVTGVIWALAACLAPYVARGHRLSVDFVRAVVWAAVLASATGISRGIQIHPAAWLGAAIGAATLLLPSLLGELRGRESLTPVP
jgi:hypothetical protein